jgi:phosphopantothenoylcysteine decarboxylase/phosphopantothenate--cysteine ligase
MSVLHSARIVLGVSGGIAAYKAADLASKLVQHHAIVDTIFTAGAEHFVAPLTFEAITKRPIHRDVFEAWSETSAGHITLAQQADIFVVAPATANTIARLAQGFADDMLGAVALSTPAPLLIAPAMEHGMLHHPATQANLQTLSKRGAIVVGPASGRLASGQMGDGRLVEAETIVGAVRQVLGRSGPLAGYQVVVTAGGTHEPIDPVRFIGNRSSGRMGYALAQAAIDAGARVTLISGPVSLPAPFGVTVIGVETALEMQGAVHDAVVGSDALIMSAAVADFRPKEARQSKIKKGSDGEPSLIELARNPDILAGIDQPGLVKIGFAAETDALIENARRKLSAKGLSMIVANDAVATIGSERSTAVLLLPDQSPVPLPDQDKAAVADTIVQHLATILRSRTP